MVIWAKTLLLVALLVPVAQGVGTYDTGAGIQYTLNAVEDVTLESSSTNYNYLEYLIVSKLPGFPNKRSLVKFENLSNACPSSKIKSAKMYLYYMYAHKASWYSITYCPFIPRCMQVHLVKKSWRETQATSSRRYNGANWSSPWLGLDGTDAEAVPQECNPVAMFPSRPRGFVEFDITSAVRSWRSGAPNHGVVIRAVNELEAGRSIRFASKAYQDSSKHPFARVLCAE